MNNLLASPAVLTLQDAEIIDAVKVVAAALNSGRVKVHPDCSVTVGGIAFLGSPSVYNEEEPITKQTANKFQFDCNTWTLQYGGKLVTRPNCVGLRYIHELLEKPFVMSHSSNLILAVNSEGIKCAKLEQVRDQDCDEDFTHSSGSISTYSIPVDEKVDHATQKQIFKKLNVLKVELESHLANGVELEAKETEEEIEALTDYLKKNCIVGRSASFSSDADKSRKSVSVAIARAIASIGKIHPVLAKHLKNSIKTGFANCYTPETETQWVL
jgi:hypothetical protein